MATNSSPLSVPAGYDINGMPFGLCFGGLKGTEPKLIEVAYAFEQATLVLLHKIPVSFLPKTMKFCKLMVHMSE
ncbi:hypothetical protein Q3G72_024111 [Acer saccharum]|nr:hypothetical protein Q3G72_024111 [Acer saccharum]